MTTLDHRAPDYHRAAFPRDLARAELAGEYDRLIALADRLDTFLGGEGEWTENDTLALHGLAVRVDAAMRAITESQARKLARQAAAPIIQLGDRRPPRSQS
jgi:hypothetical protein